MDILTWLLSDGVGAIGGWLLANLLEPMPRWAQIDAYHKRLYVMGLTILLAPLLALGLYWLIKATPPDRLTILLAFQAGFVAYAGSQYGHAKQLAAAQQAKDLGTEVISAYHNNLGVGNALTSDGSTRFAYTTQQLVEKTLDKRAHS